VTLDVENITGGFSVKESRGLENFHYYWRRQLKGGGMEIL